KQLTSLATSHARTSRTSICARTRSGSRDARCFVRTKSPVPCCRPSPRRGRTVARLSGRETKPGRLYTPEKRTVPPGETRMRKVLWAAVAAAAASAPAWAHHGFGRFDPSREIELEGTLTGIDFVNPHSYMYFDAVGADGEVTPMRCEMRAATVLRRSGWSEEMFVTGAHVKIAGRPHRDDPASCYIETLTIGDRPTVERYEQFTVPGPSVPDRPARLTSGEPNLAGDWAQEQYLIARPPSGRGGLVPKSMVACIES